MTIRGAGWTEPNVGRRERRSSTADRLHRL
jgi:hypothetical protein